MTVMVEESTTITWSSANASSCTASGAWTGEKSLSGSESIVMNDFGEQTFTLTCGSIAASTIVTVNSDNSEGSCVNPHSAMVYESYLGDYESPMPQNFLVMKAIKGLALRIMALSGFITITKEKALAGSETVQKHNTSN